MGSGTRDGCRRKPQRLRSEAARAHLCGVSPIPKGSGKSSGRLKVHDGRDRQANSALYSYLPPRLQPLQAVIDCHSIGCRPMSAGSRPANSHPPTAAARGRAMRIRTMSTAGTWPKRSSSWLLKYATLTV
jgi:hypothetical protein